MIRKTEAMVVAAILFGGAGFVAEAGASPQAGQQAEGSQDQRQAVTMAGPAEDHVTHEQTGTSAQAPLDIDDDKGLFVYSVDGRRAVRFYGSIRTRAAIDSNRTFHPFDLNTPQIPTGEYDFPDRSTELSILGTRVGVDLLVATGTDSGLLGRLELDFKGTDEKFRIRHAFLRTEHWLVGKSWTSMTNLHILPKLVDGHYAGAAVGPRTPQLRYTNAGSHFTYKISAEFQEPTLVKPDELQAEGRTLVPAAVGGVSYERGWGTAGFGAMLKPNRVQFTGETKEAQDILGYAFVLGTKLDVDENNRIKLSFIRNVGTAGYVADWAFTNIDLIFDPAAGVFENTRVFGGYVGYEHDWTATLSSTAAVGYVEVENKDFEGDLAFHAGTKGLVNLFYTAAGGINGMVIAGEVEYAERVNKDRSQNHTVRGTLLGYYDF